MAEPKFEEFLKEREQNQKQMQMENLMREFKEKKRREKVKEEKQMVFDDTPRFELRSLTDLLSEFEADNRRSPNSIDELKRYFYNKYGEDFLSKMGPIIPSDEDPINPFAPKPQGPDLPSSRMMAQTGGITESQTLPPDFIAAAQKTFLADLTRQAGIPSITTATAQQPGETPEQFAQRQAQAQQFGITRAGMAELAPQVAAQDPLQAAAYTQATDPTKGLGAFEPFLTKATTAADAASALTGTGAGTGTGSIASYTSPFQQQVIDTTLAEFDRQRQIQENRLAASALGTAGAFGGGREGVQRAEFQAASNLDRARLLADLQQKGFQNAAARRQQDLANQQAIANQQRGLGAAAQDFSRAQISGLGTLGAAQQAQTQAVLDAQRQAAQMAVDDPRRRLSMLGAGIAQLTPGAGAVNISEAAAEAPGASPLMKALGLGLAGADIYGRIFR